MASTYSNLKIQLMATGENSGTWGNVTNANLGDAIEQALVETATITFASANVTLTLSDSNSKQNARALRLNLTGTTAGARDLIVPAIQKPYLVNNGTADTITVKVSGQTGVAVPASTSMLLYNNGTDVIVAFNRVVGNLVGSADTLTTARTIAISGGVTGTATSFNGSANISISATAINVDTATAGTLAVGRGGTGATSLTADNVILGNGTSAVKFVAAGTAGNVLTSNGSAWVSEAISAGGNFVQQVYTSPATWTKPANIKSIRVTVLGGGGGGEGCRANAPQPVIVGGNGAGGGVAIEYLSAPSIPGPVTVTVGSGGPGGAAPGGPFTPTAGTAGGSSSFGPFLSATGGASGGAAGVGSGGNFNLNGVVSNSNLAVRSSTPSLKSSGGGGNPLFLTEYGRGGAASGAPGGSGANGEAAIANTGSGGGGAESRNFAPQGFSGQPAAGAAGSAGIVIVEEFY